MEELKRRLEEHMERDEKSFDSISESISTIKDNHLAHIEPDVATIKANLAWIMGIGGAVGSMILASLIALWFKQ